MRGRLGLGKGKGNKIGIGREKCSVVKSKKRNDLKLLTPVLRASEEEVEQNPSTVSA